MIYRMRRLFHSFIIWFNRLIEILKYPIAIGLLLSTPFLLMSLYRVLAYIITHIERYYPLLIGIALYLLIWKLIANRIANGWFATLEHELTHALFALVTFHKVTDFKATLSNGGHVRYSGVGGGNWLITISPYFFPTFSGVILGLMYLSKSQFQPILLAILGFSIIYHLHSTWHEIHPKQTDLKEVGFTFAWIFLPSANILALICVLVLVPNDRLYLGRVLGGVYNNIDIITLKWF